MSAGEVLWRARTALRDARFRTAANERAALRAAEQAFDSADQARGFSVLEAERCAGLRTAGEDVLCNRADAILAGRTELFDRTVDLREPTCWNMDLKVGRMCGLAPASEIDYRDFEAVGDAKFVWEPNRHLHLVVLARAYHATGERRYAEGVAEQLASWLAACPYKRGMNWRSPLEFAIRLINWVWAADLIEPAGVLRGDLRAGWLKSVYLHLHEITRNYSRGSSANNHLIGEAAGVYVAATYFRGLRRAAEWRREALAILQREIQRQVYADGGAREQAFGYHTFILQFFAIAAGVADACGDALDDAYRARLGKMREFARALLEAGGAPPNYGDADDGYVLDLGRGGGDLTGWLGEAAEDRLRPRAFPETGVYLLQSGVRDSGDGVSVPFDCGAHGFPSIAAHAHADALSFTLRAFGRDVIVDPGTFDYFSFPAWRDFFRSTRAHATLEVDGIDQSRMLGPFLWGARANARCLAWEPADTGGRVAGEHDGYVKTCGALHRRELVLNGTRLVVRDELTLQRPCVVRAHLPLAEHCRASVTGAGRAQIVFPGGEMHVSFEPNVELQLMQGSETPIAGWVSRGYHRRAPAPVLCAAFQATPPVFRIACEVNLTATCAGAEARPRDSELAAVSAA